MKSIYKYFVTLCLLALMIGIAPCCAAADDFKYNVEYWATISELATQAPSSSAKSFTIIDTSGGNLPTNAKPNPKTKTIWLDTEYRVAKKNTLTEIYRTPDPEGYSYSKAPGVNYIDQITNSQGNFVLDSITVHDSNGTQVGGKIERNPSNLVFTNDTHDTDGTDGVIGLAQGYTVKLYYTPASSPITINDVHFYDYDVTNGVGTKDGKHWVGNTVGKGINSNVKPDAIGLHFGNRNIYLSDDTTFKKYSDDKVSGDYYINIANKLLGKDSNGYTIRLGNIEQGSYGITTNQLNGNGLPVYANGIQAPALFGSAGAAGKYELNGKNTLTFTKVGNEYRLSSSTVGHNSQTYTRNYLDQILNVAGSAYGNNFFPLDGLTPSNHGAKDPLFGDPNELYYYGTKQDDSLNPDAVLPVSDDNQAHNSYFGMMFDVKFTLPANYIGPLDYLFFGDDDMWIYLVPLKSDGTGDFAKSKKICDIGGVHSSIGEFVNLWDYISGGKNGSRTSDQAYMLRFFYLERGSSGSSCYMEFTLPQVWPVQPQMVRGAVEFDKTVVAPASILQTNPKFYFTVKLEGTDDLSRQRLAVEKYSCLIYEGNSEDPSNYLLFNGSEANGTNGLNVSIGHNQRVFIGGLPVGTRYTITETVPDAYVVSPSQSASGTISSYNDTATGTILGETDSESFTNTLKTGTLEVKKLLVSEVSAESSQSFTFSVTLKDTSGNPVNDTFGGIAFTNGVATFSLKGGETKTLSGLPTGYSYVVTEDTPSNFVAAWNGQSGSIGNGTTVTATATNTRAPGSLSITKTVQSEVDADLTRAYAFKVTLTDEDNTPINGTFGGITFTNGVATFSLKSGETKTITELPAGYRYEVSEDDADNYLVAWINRSGVIQSNQIASVSAQNTRKTGTLKVEKLLVSEVSADSTMDFNFTVTLKDTSGNPVNDTFGGIAFTNGVATFSLKGGKTQTLSGLPIGYSYAVTEDTPSNFVAAWDGQSGSIGDGTTVTATATNTRRTGDLTVTKTVISDVSADSTMDFNFTVTLKDASGNLVNDTFGGITFTNGVATFSLKGGETITLSGLPAGYAYTVEETNGDGFTVTSSGTTGTIAEDTPATAVFTNKKGGLTVTKQLVGYGTDPDQAFDFTVTLSDYKDGDTVLHAASSVNGEFGLIDKTQVTFTKGVATFSLKGGETMTASGLPAHLEFTVKETDPLDGHTIIYTGDISSGSIPAGSKADVTVTNKKDAGHLTVEKKVQGNWTGAPNMEFGFTVTLSDKSINATYGDMTFINGVATFTLKHGESKTALKLPVGVEYTVTEADTRYTESAQISVKETGEIIQQISTRNSLSGSIPENQEHVVLFTNERNIGNLMVGKTVSGADGEYGRKFIFRVELDDQEKLSGTYGDMTFENGVATLELAHGETAVASGLPGNIGYTVTEIYPETGDEDGYTITYKGNTSALAQPASLEDEKVPSESKDVSVGGIISEGNADSIVFNNENPGPVPVRFLAMKTYDGKAPEHRIFSFELRDEKDNVLQTKQNDGTGLVEFDTILLDLPGVYTYTINELIESRPNTLFDPSIYTAIVTVSKTEEFELTGCYSASIELLKDGNPYELDEPDEPELSEPVEMPLAETENGYIEPEETKPNPVPLFQNSHLPDPPSTGDNSRLFVWLSLFMISALSVLLVIKRPRSSN